VETAEEVQQRVQELLALLEELTMQHASVLVVSHSGFLRQLWSRLGLGEKDFANLEVASLALDWEHGEAHAAVQ
jgi:broad specificity phosphatase PhoE